jgi:hypothetical protein
MDDIGGLRPQRVWVARPRRGPMPPMLVRPLCLLSLTSSSPGVSRDEILTLQKSQVNLSPERSLKLKIRKTWFSYLAEL